MDEWTILPARLREHALADGAVLKPPGSARHREGVAAANLDGPDFVVPAADRDVPTRHPNTVIYEPPPPFTRHPVSKAPLTHQCLTVCMYKTNLVLELLYIS